MTNAKKVGLVLAALVALNVVVALLATLLRTPGGAPSSSYATVPEGLAAYSSLLEELGYETEAYRRPLGSEPLDPGITLVLVDPPAVSTEATAVLDRFVESGGRLVTGGGAPLWLDEVVADPPEWDGTLEPALEAFGGLEVTTGGEGAWSDEGGGTATVGAPDAALVVEASEGRGVAVLVADVSPLRNRLLDEGGNAAFGLALAGSRDRPVVFVESVHGYGVGEGFAALPPNWKWTLAGLGLGGLVWLWARAMRLGPPEESARSLPPPRRAYVEALAATLARTERAKRGNP